MIRDLVNMTMAAFLLSGCVNSIPTQRYKISDIVLICADKDQISKGYNSHPLRKNKEAFICNGYADLLRREIYVEWSDQKDIRNEPLPDFGVLGHEVWHLIKGRYHNE